MAEQGQELMEELNAYARGQARRDDVAVLGLRLRVLGTKE